MVLAEEWLPRTAWTYWEQPLETDSVIQLFHLNHLHFSSQSNWELKILNKFSVIEQLRKVDSYQNDLETFQFPTQQAKVEYIKVCLLKHFGGVWIDYLAILTENLNWLDKSKLEKSSDVLYSPNSDIQFLCFTFPGKGSIEDFVLNKNYTFEASLSYKIEFMAAKPNTAFINQLYSFYRSLYVGKQRSIIDSSFSQPAEYSILTRKHEELSKKSKTQRINVLSHFKIWSIDPSRNALFYHINLQDRTQIHYLLRFNVANVGRMTGSLKRLMKVSFEDLEPLKKYLLPYDYQGFEKTIQKLKLLNESEFDNIDRVFCDDRYRIDNNSIISLFLIQLNPKIVNQTNNIVQRQFISFDYYCEPLKKFMKDLGGQQKKFFKQYKYSRLSSIQKSLFVMIQALQKSMKGKEMNFQLEEAYKKIQKISQQLSKYNYEFDQKQSNIFSLLEKINQVKLQNQKLKLQIQLKQNLIFQRKQQNIERSNLNKIFLFSSITIIFITLISWIVMKIWARSCSDNFSYIQSDQMQNSTGVGSSSSKSQESQKRMEQRGEL